MTYAALAPLTAAIAFALALGFHRNRAALMFLVMIGFAFATVTEETRDLRGAAAFAPWLLFAAALLPEARIVSQRSAIFAVLWLFALGVTLHAPTHVFDALSGLFGRLVFGLSPAHGATALTLAAAALCLTRWVLVDQPMELGLTLALALVAVAFAHLEEPAVAAAYLAGAGALGVLAVLYASYRMAFVDALTGLPNRRALDETLARATGQYALAMVDVDHFKRFNDSYGHAAGDLVLRQVGRQLRRHAGARAFRFGGEEFCLLFDAADAKVAEPGCERARAAVEARAINVPAPVSSKSKTKGEKRIDVSVTVSIGLAARDTVRKHALEVLKAADQALYAAKAKGRNKVIRAM